MPTIGRIGSFDVMIYRNDHDPPHFHVFGGAFLAKFTIADCALLSSKGRIGRRGISSVERWGQKHQIERYLNWNLARAGEPPQKIEGYPMQYEIAEAVPHPDHTVTVTWVDGVRGVVSFRPFQAKGGVFTALRDPDYFAREMRILRGGIGLAWPNDVDFSADGLRHDAFAKEQSGEYDAVAATAGDARHRR